MARYELIRSFSEKLRGIRYFALEEARDKKQAGIYKNIIFPKIFNSLNV